MTTKLNESANGVYVIAATPFADDGSLDFAWSISTCHVVFKA
jgi:hypothetical protein